MKSLGLSDYERHRLSAEKIRVSVSMLASANKSKYACNTFGLTVKSCSGSMNILK